MAAATTPFLLFTFSSTNPPPSLPSQMDYFLAHHPMPSFFILCFSVTLFLLSLTVIILLKINKNKRTRKEREIGNPHIGKISSFPHPPVDIDHKDNEEIDNENIVDKSINGAQEPDTTRMSHSLLLEILPSDSTKWEKLFCDKILGGPEISGSDEVVERVENGDKQQNTKKRKKRAKKKRPDSSNSNNDDGEGEKMKESGGLAVVECPFTTSCSATQRKIKQQYDQLVKSHQSNGLTLAQVAEFVNCLIEARNDLQHKSEVIQRRFTITKALLFRADRSSFDRLRQQIYKLESEQKRLEEDACVYNWLQQQLKLSPAYKRMLEIGACMEMEAKSSEDMESTDAEFADISFEELLAQEKKDTFWQRHGKPKQWSRQ